MQLVHTNNNKVCEVLRSAAGQPTTSERGDTGRIKISFFIRWRVENTNNDVMMSSNPSKLTNLSHVSQTLVWRGSCTYFAIVHNNNQSKRASILLLFIVSSIII
jgi:hypothetical protein